MSIKKQIRKLGWELEVHRSNADISQFSDYRAVRGDNYCTPWRSTPEQVLTDLRQLKSDAEEANHL